jgi:hypothetical protein
LETIARTAAIAAGAGKRIRLPHVCHAITMPRAASPVSGGTDVERMVQAGMAMDAIITECRKAAVETALRMAGESHPTAPKTKRIESAAQRLDVSVRHVYDCLRPLPANEP